MTNILSQAASMNRKARLQTDDLIPMSTARLYWLASDAVNCRPPFGEPVGDAKRGKPKAPEISNP